MCGCDFDGELDRCRNHYPDCPALTGEKLSCLSVSHGFDMSWKESSRAVLPGVPHCAVNHNCACLLSMRLTRFDLGHLFAALYSTEHQFSRNPSCGKSHAEVSLTPNIP